MAALHSRRGSRHSVRVNRTLLIDQVVRQTMVLIAHLATQGGARAPLSDVAESVFRGLVDELAAEGVSHKVIADMFGLALRTYYDRVKRITESHTLRGRSLWEAVFEHVRERKSVTRAAVLQRFRGDDEAIVKAVLHDLVESGLVARSGRGEHATYLIVPTPDASADETLAALVHVALFHRVEADVAGVSESLGVGRERVAEVLERLVGEGRIERVPGASGEAVYRAQSCLIAADDPVGFEGAIYDHTQAVVGALCHRLRRRGRAESIDRSIGGSTYTFDVAPDNPTWERVLGLLGRLRVELSALRAEADAFEGTRPEPRPSTIRVLFYCGQNVLAEDVPTPLDEE